MSKEAQLKYKLDELIEQLPKRWEFNLINGVLKRYDISQPTFFRDRKIPFDSPVYIPSNRLEIYAKLFGVTMEELKNYEFIVTPFVELDPDNLSDDQLTKKFNLIQEK